MKKGDIRFHKQLNLMPINFEKEILINVFYGVVKKFNQMNEPGILEISKKELWELMGFDFKEYKSSFLREVLTALTKSTSFEVNNELKIYGSIFGAKIEENIVKIAVGEFYKPYIFTKTDIELMTKAKNNEKMHTHELDYWDNNLKHKSKKLVLLKEADILGIKGKYSKRFYTLLGQFKETGFYVVKMDKFRKIMEIPNSYRMSEIDKQVLSPAKKELRNKTGIEIIEIKKIKKGRKIDRIEFYFKFPEKENKKIGLVKKRDNVINENNEISETMVLFKEKIIERIKDNYRLRAELAPLKYQDDIEKFVIKYNINL